MDVYIRRYNAEVREGGTEAGRPVSEGPWVWWDSAGLEKQELRSTFPLSHSTTGSDCLSLMGTTVQDKFRTSPSLPALKKEKPTEIW